MDFERLTTLRKNKDNFFKSHPQSPLTAQQKESFDGLAYYPPNPLMYLTVRVKPFEKKEDVQIQTTTGDMRWYRRYGEFTFNVDGEQARLTIYQTGDNLFFLPFVDANGGKETYGAGRYLEPEPLDDDRFLIDLNQAYNPYCAYNDGWNCPITPAENRLSVAIKAGEKIPTGDWLEHR